MPSTRASDLSQRQRPIQIRQDDKFFSKVLLKESSMINYNNTNSFRIYHGGVSSSVPFTWESQPGTPKHHAYSEATLAPLTPPPSHYSDFVKKNSIKNNHHSSSNLLNTLFLKLSIKKSGRHPRPSPSVSSLSSSSWSSSHSSIRERRSQISSFGSSYSSSKVNNDHEGGRAIVGSPTSTLCFRVGRENNIGGCSSTLFMKKALLSIVGHGQRSN